MSSVKVKSLALSLFLIVFGNTSYSQCCGDGICDSGEDAANCPYDCGNASSFNCGNTIGSFYTSPSFPVNYATASANGWCYSIPQPYPATVCFEYIVPPVTEPVQVSFSISACNTGGINQGNAPGGCNTANINNSVVSSVETYDNNCTLIGNGMQTGGCYSTGDIITVCLNLNVASDCGTITICPVLNCGTADCSTSASSAVTCPPFNFTSSSTYEDVCDANSGVVVVTPLCGSHFNYTWDDSNSTTDSIVTGLSAGTYQVMVTNAAFPTCDTTMSVTLAPISGILIDNVQSVNPQCAGDCNGSITISASGGSGNLTYHWENSLGNPIGTNTPAINNLCAGTYQVEVSDNSGCVVEQSFVLMDPALAQPDFTIENFCVGQTVPATNVTPVGGVFSFNPSPSDGATINPTTGLISNGVAGATYHVQYTVNQATCPEFVSQIVSVYPNPTPVITGTLMFCQGGSAQLNAGSGYMNYSWSNGGNTQIINTGAVTNLTVTVTDANGCVGTSEPITVTESSTILTNSVQHICQGQSAVIHGVSQNTAGVYAQTFPSASGCDSISEVQLIVHSNPNPTITGNLIFCHGDSAHLNTGLYEHYLWSTGDTTQNISTTTGAPITVTVTDANGCVGTSSPVSLVLPPVAIVHATPTSGQVPLEVLLTNASLHATNFSWDFGNDSTLNTIGLSSHQIVYDSVGQYTVMLIAEENGCIDTAYVVIVVHNEMPLGFVLPNIITPDGDQVNDYFTFNLQHAKSVEVRVYNRWGIDVFYSTDVDFKWNGTVGGNLVTDGVYFYQYKIEGIDGEILEGQQFLHVIY